MYVVMGIVGLVYPPFEKKAWARIPRLFPELHISLLYSWIVAIGFVSTLYHSTLAPWAVCGDFLAINLFCIFLWFGFRKVAFYPISIALGVLCSTPLLLFVAEGWPSFGPWVHPFFYVVICGFMVQVFWCVWRHFHFKNFKNVAEIQEQGKWWFWTGTYCFCAALFFYFIPVLCASYRTSSYGWLLRGHAYWHVLSAVALFCCVRAVSYIPDVNV